MEGPVPSLPCNRVGFLSLPKILGLEVLVPMNQVGGEQHVCEGPSPRRLLPFQMKCILERSQVSCINSLESGSLRRPEGNLGMIKRGFCVCARVHVGAGLWPLRAAPCLPATAACLELQKYSRLRWEHLRWRVSTACSWERP